MKFKANTRRRALEYEKDWVQKWKQDRTFEKSVETRPKDNSYVFYDGPPFITGVPHHGTLLSSIVKDAVPRYWTMKGRRVERVWGWDTHGLPAENFVEKQLNITDRRQIVTSDDQPAPLDKDGNELPVITLEHYITKARESMVANATTWENVVDRIGRWVDFTGAYRTMDKDFMESVWWAFKKLYDGGKIYEGEKVLMYDTKFATPVSKAEVTMDNDAYQTVTDPSVYVKFELKNDAAKSELPRVLFVCQANLGRSQIARGLYNKYTNTDSADSAGVSVDTKFYPGALSLDEVTNERGKPLGSVVVMQEKDIDIAFAKRTQLTPDMVEKYDIVVDLMKDDEERPEWFLSKHVEHWNIDDIGVGRADIRKTRDTIETKVRELANRYAAIEAKSVSLLAWTTTPWTLPANLMLAVNLEMTYNEILVGDEKLIIAKEALGRVLKDEKNQPLEYEVLREFPGSELVGKSYEPLDTGSTWPIYVSEASDVSIRALSVDDGEKEFEYLKHVPQNENDFHNPADSDSLKSLAAFKQFLQKKADDSQGKNLASGRVPDTVYWIEKAGEIVGVADVRHYLNDKLLETGGGHIGLGGIKYRNQGIGTAANKLLIKKVFELGEPIVTVGAMESNFASQKMIEKSGGVLDRTIDDEANPGSKLCIYTINKDALKDQQSDSKIHKIYAADFVSNESGSGIVHVAPAYGEDDFELAKSMGVAPFHVIDDNGYYTDTSYKGLEVWGNNKFIAKDLKERGIVWKIDYIRHEYPFNPRSKQRIMYRAIPSWFFDIQGSKPLMLEQNENINWFPEHLKHGRFAKNIEQAPDWNLSRDRFWATAMPVWKGDKGSIKVIGSYAELKELSGVGLEDYHRPWVDDITFEIDGEKFTRIDKVLDGWFESGSMPFAQLHYPFENQEKFEENYPADFIVEYVGQVRAWFYYVHAVNTSLAEIGAFGEDSKQPEKNAFKNVITTGVIAGNDGRKMSKSLGNFTDPNELMDKFSADSLRFLLLSSPLLNGEDFALHDKDVGDVARKLSMIWNMYDFFTMYAEVDGWEYDGNVVDPLDSLKNPLDIWIVSRVHQLAAEVEKHMDEYNIPDALSPILPFLDDASNWYVRRSRRRFWKSEDDGDKNDAYKTLHYVLVRLSYLLAPFTPFLAEELYHNLTGDSESIHLKDWLSAGGINESTVQNMTRTRELINTGLGLRMRKDENQDSIKVRQPLQSASYSGEKLDTYYEQIMKEELNVKEIRWVENLDEHLATYDAAEGKSEPESWVEISKKITPGLKREGLMREVIRFVQSARKSAGLNVDDRIVLSLMIKPGKADDLEKAIEEHSETIAQETLVARFADVQDGYDEMVKIEGAELRIALKKS